MQKGGSIHKFEENADVSYEIGRGGYGIVLVDPNQPNSVFKVSNKRHTCRQWNVEASIYTTLNQFNMDDKLVKVIKMKDYVNDGNKCTMELTRAFNPLDIAANFTIQPMFGLKEFELTHRGRGLFLGIDQLIARGIFTDKSMAKYMGQLGKVMSRLHYLAQNDGYDIELFVSSSKKGNCVFIGDFDLSEPITEYSPSIRERIVWSLTAVSYFPNPANPDLYLLFKDGYVAEAAKYGKADVAEQVMASYEEYYR